MQGNDNKLSTINFELHTPCEKRLLFLISISKCTNFQAHFSTFIRFSHLTALIPDRIDYLASVFFLSSLKSLSDSVKS